MNEPVVSTGVSVPADPSFADLRKLIADEPVAQAAETPAADAPKTDTPEPAAAVAEPESPEPAKAEPAGDAKPADAAEKAEPAEGTGEKKQEPKEDDHVKLPPAVQKRVDREIARANNARKEIEALRDKLKEQVSAIQGTEPVKPAQDPKSDSKSAAAKPAKPKLDDYKTYAEYEGAVDKYEHERDAWLIAETRRTVSEELTAEQRKALERLEAQEVKKSWGEAVKRHGGEFADLMQTVVEATPEGLQLAISGLDDWSGVAAHLAQNPEELAGIVEKFDKSPVAAIAELGRLEQRLQPAPKTQPKEAAEKPKAKPLPAPPAKVGGAPAPSASVDLDKADMRVFKREIGKYLDR